MGLYVAWFGGWVRQLYPQLKNAPLKLKRISGAPSCSLPASERGSDPERPALKCLHMDLVDDFHVTASIGHYNRPIKKIERQAIGQTDRSFTQTINIVDLGWRRWSLKCNCL